MDPTHFIAAAGLARKNNCKAGPTEIAAFYDQHGCEKCVTFSSLPKRIRRTSAKFLQVGNWRPNFADSGQTR